MLVNLHQRGLTLLELVLSLVVGSAVLVLLVPAMHYVIAQPERAFADQKAAQSAFVVAETLRRAVGASSRTDVLSDQCIQTREVPSNPSVHASAYPQTMHQIQKSYCFTEQGLVLRSDNDTLKPMLIASAVKGTFSVRNTATESLLMLDYIIHQGRDYPFSQIIMLPSGRRPINLSEIGMVNAY